MKINLTPEMEKQRAALDQKLQRGSALRCFLLMNDSKQVPGRLIKLVQPYAKITDQDYWMPRGLVEHTEARLGSAQRFLSSKHKAEIKNWWLAVQRNANTPNWDIACTASIDSQEGLVLVEAKAHQVELKTEGKKKDTKTNLKNHEKIKNAIRNTNGKLNAIMPGWNLERDSHYQLANRFAWAWKVASMGKPVILVYLGFLNASDMKNDGKLFTNHEDWENAVKDYAKGRVPDSAWGKKLSVNGTTLLPLILSMQVDYS